SSIHQRDRLWSIKRTTQGNRQAKPHARIERPDFAPLGPITALGKWPGVTSAFEDQRLFFPYNAMMSSLTNGADRHAAADYSDLIRCRTRAAGQDARHRD